MQACLRVIANGLSWVGLAGTVSAELVVTFEWLGDLHGGGFYSLSHDGSVIVGAGGGPWCWSVSLNRWLYIPDASADAGMGWVYVTR